MLLSSERPHGIYRLAKLPRTCCQRELYGVLKYRIISNKIGQEEVVKLSAKHVCKTVK